jgi:drug/metabolite transporter (DMT)-like permease
MSLAAHALALTGALCSAAATVLIRKGLRGSNAYTGFWINVVVGTLGLWGTVLLLAPHQVFQIRAVPFFILSGLIGTVMGRLLRFVSIEKVGASVAAAITNLNPFISTGLAILLLGERVTFPILAGTFVIVLGTTVLSLSGRHVGFRVRHLVYPFLCASCFGTVAIIRKLGLSQTGPLFGSAVNTTTALLAFTTFLFASGNRHALRCKGQNLWYFIAAGVAENGGVFLVLVALSLGEVSVVTPLSGAAPLFVLPLAFFFLKGVEVLSWRVVLGATLIVLGVGLLTA